LDAQKKYTCALDSLIHPTPLSKTNIDSIDLNLSHLLTATRNISRTVSDLAFFVFIAITPVIAQPVIAHAHEHQALLSSNANSTVVTNNLPTYYLAA
jgi:hypothetical protein